MCLGVCGSLGLVPMGMFKDLTLVGLHWCIPAAAQLCYARLQQKGLGSMVCEVLGLL